jgi:hypothetical protein
METLINSINKKDGLSDLFFDMFVNSAVGMFVVETETSKFKFANKAFLSNLGFSKDD